MIFILENVYVEDDAHGGIFKVAEFGTEPKQLRSTIDARAKRKGFNMFKSTVPLDG